MNRELLAEAIVTHRHVKHLYEFGFIGIYHNDVQLDMEAFSFIKDLGEVKISRRRGDTDFPYEASVTYRDVKFITIGTVLEFDTIGINVL